MSLPGLPYPRSILRPEVQTVFGGMNRNPSAGEGELYDMENLTARDWPLLATRPPRTLMHTMGGRGSLGTFRDDEGVQKFVWTEDGESSAELHLNQENGQEQTVTGLTLAKGQKRFLFMAGRLLIFPDGISLDPTPTGTEGAYVWDWESLGTEWSGTAEFVDGALGGVPAEGNTLKRYGLAGTDFRTRFKAGDAVEIRYDGEDAVWKQEADTSAVIREVSATQLRFDENTFSTKYPMTLTGVSVSAGTDCCFTRNGVICHFNTGTQAVASGDRLLYYGGVLEETCLYYFAAGETEYSHVYTVETVAQAGSGWRQLDFVPEGAVTVTRAVPTLEGVFLHENRVWGYAGNTVYASKLGDSSNFRCFEGLSTDSWTLEWSGRFTGCCEYQNYPVFFTEDGAWRVLGDLPENFTLRKAAGMGVRQDSPRRIAEAGGTLFWLSPWGVCAWRGGDPAVISGPLGERYTFQEGTAGSDGVRYYFSARYHPENSDFGAMEQTFCVYDTRKDLWHREDGTEALEFVTDGPYALWVAKDREGWQTVYRVWSSKDLSGDIMQILDDWPDDLEEDFSWTAEFADSARFYETSDVGSQNKKGLLRLLIRGEIWGDRGNSMTVWVRYDAHENAYGSDEGWEELRTIHGEALKQSFRIPLILRRCDHYRLKLTGRGQARIYSITAEKYAGSEKQNG